MSLETILIVGAVAFPIPIFFLKVGWPMVKRLFVRGVDELDTEIQAASQ